MLNNVNKHTKLFKVFFFFFFFFLKKKKGNGVHWPKWRKNALKVEEKGNERKLPSHFILHDVDYHHFVILTDYFYFFRLYFVS